MGQGRVARQAQRDRADEMKMPGTAEMAEVGRNALLQDISTGRCPGAVSKTVLWHPATHDAHSRTQTIDRNQNRDKKRPRRQGELCRD